MAARGLALRDIEHVTKQAAKRSTQDVENLQTGRRAEGLHSRRSGIAANLTAGSRRGGEHGRGGQREFAHEGSLKVVANS